MELRENPDTVGRIAVNRPSVIAIFDRHGIDYAFHGYLTLEEACAEAVADLDEVRSDLASATTGDHDILWSERTLSELSQYIEEHHHDFTRRVLNDFGAALKEALDLGEVECDTAYVHIRRIFFSFRDDLLEHMSGEEQTLFPYVRKIEAAVLEERAMPSPIRGTINCPAAHSMEDHERAVSCIESLSRLVSTIPDRQLRPNVSEMERLLTDLEQNMRMHVHLENNILFARARSYETGQYVL